MSTFKCKMCGGTLEIEPNETIATCEYCGTQQTLPKLDDERRANLYDRANHFRRNNEFDKAMGIYEKILNEDNTDHINLKPLDTKKSSTNLKKLRSYLLLFPVIKMRMNWFTNAIKKASALQPCLK